MPQPTCSHIYTSSVFFFNDTATTEIYTLSLHDALPISHLQNGDSEWREQIMLRAEGGRRDRKSTRLNSSHVEISYAVFCLKKKKQLPPLTQRRREAHATACVRRPASAVHTRGRSEKTAPEFPGLRGTVSLYIFFFKKPGAPGIFPLSPPPPLPI